MERIKTVMFDMGGVIITLDQQEAIRRLNEFGLTDAAERLDPYTQGGIFGELERGAISPETFRDELSKLCGRQLSHDDCRYAWLGYIREVPQRNLDLLCRLRDENYRLLLLSNTNPFMMSWVNSNDFTGGRPLKTYFDQCYLSYELKNMKPHKDVFRHVLVNEHVSADEILFVDDGPRNVSIASELGFHTFCPENGADWTQEIYKYL